MVLGSPSVGTQIPPAKVDAAAPELPATNASVAEAPDRDKTPCERATAEEGFVPFPTK
ncbi:MAG: hypothetical protein WB662_06610 [Methyloceanibacter sp.]|jgi:hypothetical protein